MKKIVMNGHNILSGTISISGAKNSVVALIPAAILTDEDVVINNVPKLSDTENLEKIIDILGGKITFGDGTLKIQNANLKNELITEELSQKLRASYYFMGSLLARFHHVEIYFPGGCKIGARPIDYHINAFKQMGAIVTQDENDKYILDAPNLHGAEIEMPFRSVGATINVMLAASLANGKTVIKNAAREPEIINIQDMLNSMGAKVEGAGSDEITIEGVKSLHGATVDVIPDRIEAGTYIMIGALIGKNLKIENIVSEHLSSLLFQFDKMGIKYQKEKDSITISKSDNILPSEIVTEVYPGFPTDLGQPMSVIMTQANGESKFKETIYESRNGHFGELVKMGANIDYTSNSAIIRGKSDLVGCNVEASDLRAGAALIIASLIADGTTKISNIEYILRGYEDIVEKLANVGADIKIIEE